MRNAPWRVYIDYGSGYGWVPVNWAPVFDTLDEANKWISGDHDWEARVEAFQEEEETDEQK
jgi:hypothetical protein